MTARRRHFPRSSAAARAAALVAAMILAAIVGACGSSAANSAPTPPPTSEVLPATAAGDTPSPVAATSDSPTETAGDVTALGGTVAKGGDLCGLLGPGDFTAAGIPGAGPPVENFDDAGNYYCVYAGDSGATGGIEFDAFVGDPAGAYKTMAESAGITAADATAELAGVDKAGTILNGPGGMAAIAVCEGQLCFDVELPTTSGSRAELIALAGIVLQRGSGLTP